MNYFKGDPYWFTVRFATVCRSCGKEIKKGEQAFKYKDGSILGEKCNCGREAERDFMAHAYDEMCYRQDFC